jgi:hypothetical protein
VNKEMGIKDRLPLIRSESRIIRLFGYVVYAFVILFIIGILIPSPPPIPEALPTPTPTIATPTTLEKTVASSDIRVSEYDITLVRNYEIVKTEDISIKALDKPLSTYSTSEIEKLPMNIRKEYRVVVTSDISKEELKSTLIQVVMDKTSENHDIDEVVVFAYDRKEDTGSIYTFGRVEWCPNGDWAGVTSIIASTNDRSSYQYNFDIKDKVGTIDASDRPTEREFEIHDYYDGRLLEETKKLIEAEDAGSQYKYADQEELENAVRKEVANKYGISEEELDKIYIKVWTYKMK